MAKVPNEQQNSNEAVFAVGSTSSSVFATFPMSNLFRIHFSIQAENVGEDKAPM